MNVRAYIIFLLLSLHLLVTSVSSAALSTSYLSDINKKLKLHNYVVNIDKMKREWQLGHRDYKDLLEIVELTEKEFKNDKVFNSNDALAIMIVESRLNHKARNKIDGGAGLGQITHIGKYYKKELAYMSNPFDKAQNIKAIRIILNDKYKTYKTKHLAIKRYNGGGPRADKYALRVIALSKQIKRLNS